MKKPEHIRKMIIPADVCRGMQYKADAVEELARGIVFLDRMAAQFSPGKKGHDGFLLRGEIIPPFSVKDPEQVTAYIAYRDLLQGSDG